jgi:TonB family protein
VQERIDLVVVAQEKRKTAGLSFAVVVSAILHTALIILFLTAKPQQTAQNVPVPRFIELIKQNPAADDFVEAPGPKLDKAPSLNAPLSDANRKASMPEPTGDAPTKRPGDGSGLYTPPLGSSAPAAPQQQQAQEPRQAQQAQPQIAATQPSTDSGAAAQPRADIDDTFLYRERNNANKASAAASAAVDWRSAIRQVKGPIGGGEGLDLGNAAGGEKGLAEQGPISFETKWFDWGPYAQSMVSKIRVNWYANMPQLIKTGIGGVVTIRFQIERDGRVTNLTILKSSGHPPYDFAARKAIELSSPLNPLPSDFPNASERVTAMFYYNTPIAQ